MLRAARPTRRAALAATLALPGLARAQVWPTQPLRVVVPYPAGGGVDVMLRVITPKMSERLGQPVVVENRAGANANLGPDFVRLQRADGTTLLASATYLVLNPLLEERLPWKPEEFTPIARLTLTPNVFVVSAERPWRTLGEFVAAARAQPGLAIGTSGPGAPQSMVQELLRLRAGLAFNMIPYRGAPPVMTDLLAGTLAMSVLPLGSVLGTIQAGRLRALAVASETRTPLLPDVPTTPEAGFPENVVVSWYGLHAPAGTPDAALQALVAAARAATMEPEVREAATRAGGETAFLDRAAFTGFLAEDRARWERTVAALKRG